MNLTQMRQVLTDEGIQLTKSLGQNFLHDTNQLRKIAEAGMLTRDDTVLEIGPGLGPLTEALLALSGKVVAVEMDLRLVELLEKRFSGNDRLQLIHCDALKYIRERPDWHLWKVVSNLPYSVGSPIMVDLAMAEKPPQTMVMTVQLEVAKRISAPCNAPDYGILTLLIQQAFKPKSWFKIPSRCFFPTPGVDSACVILERRDPPLLTATEKPVFMKLVKQGFSQRRKMMLKLLKQQWPEETLLLVFKQLNISVQARAETVTLKQFAVLARALAKINEQQDASLEKTDSIR
jgi:16S rRNA (adenine1518-N6/adenine1519-N6)-dimethyltransferase